MRAHRPIFFALLPLIACGGAPPVQHAVVTPVSSSTTAPVAPTADTGPVAMPDNVVLVARVANAAASGDKLSRMLKIPLSPTEMLGNDKAAEAVDLSKPVDLVITLEDSKGKPDPAFAVAAAVRSLEDARTQLSAKNDLVPGENGTFKIVPKSQKPKGPPVDANHDGKPDADDDDDDDNDGNDDHSCALAPAFGPSPYRLVCAETDALLAKLTPYLTRGVTRLPLGQDVHVEAFAAPVKKPLMGLRLSFAREMKSGAAKLPALTDLLAAYDPFEFALDMDHMTLDASLDDGAATASMGLVFREKQSIWTKAITSHPELAGPPPAAFLRLPQESDFASYTHGFDAADLDKLRSAGGDLISQGMQSDGMTPADAQALVSALRNTVGEFAGPVVIARGVDVLKARAAVDAYGKAKDEAGKTKAAKTALELVAGWEIVGLDQPIAKVGPNLKEYMALLGRPTFAKYYKDNSDDAVPPTMKAGAPIAGLPADSVHLEVTFTHDTTPAPAPGAKGKVGARKTMTTKLHVVAMPDQGRTWVVDAMDEATLTARCKALLPGSTEPTLATRTDIDLIKTKGSNAGGFVTMQGIGLDVPLAWAQRTPTEELANGDPLGGMTTPLQGAAALPMIFTEQSPPAGMAGSMTATMRVSKEAIGDAMALWGKLF